MPPTVYSCIINYSIICWSSREISPVTNRPSIIIQRERERERVSLIFNTKSHKRINLRVVASVTFIICRQVQNISTHADVLSLSLSLSLSLHLRSRLAINQKFPNDVAELRRGSSKLQPWKSSISVTDSTEINFVVVVRTYISHSVGSSGNNYDVVFRFSDRRRSSISRYIIRIVFVEKKLWSYGEMRLNTVFLHPDERNLYVRMYNI